MLGPSQTAASLHRSHRLESVSTTHGLSEWDVHIESGEDLRLMPSNDLELIFGSICRTLVQILAVKG